MRLPNPSQNHFATIPQANIPRSVFDRSFTHKTCLDAGKIIPFLADEILPGDTFNVKATIFARMMTPAVPIIDNLYIRTFFFFIPNRLVWENWQKFCGETDDPYDPDNPNDYEIPQIVAGVSGFAANSLADYFGMPTGVAGISVSALYHRAYNLCIREWFRDQNTEDAPVVDKDDAASDESDYPVAYACKARDYFTSCLPWPQRGPGVELPLTGNAPISGIVVSDSAGKTWTTTGCTGAPGTDVSGSTWSFSTGGIGIRGLAGDVNKVDMYADLSLVTAATINSLREAFQLQRMYERDARGGGRYKEILLSHFGVVSPDQRLQRPEFLGGGTSPIMITPVAQTSVSGTTPQGHLTAFATGAAHDGFVKSFTEHGILLGLCQIKAQNSYQYGIDRKFSRLTRFDFYWPALSHLGEEPVYNREIYAKAEPANASTNAAVFGYQERYASYRYANSIISSQLRSNHAQSLDIWHLGQEYTDYPTLGPTFLHENPPIARVSLVTNEPHFIMDSYIKMKCVRPMPVYSVPGLIDHF